MSSQQGHQGLGSAHEVVFMTKRCLPVAALAAASILASACGSAAATATNNQTLVWAWNFAPTASWALETDDASYLTQAGVAEPLVRVGATGTLGPGLATSWSRLDPLTWQFNLRQGVKFQNGTALNAAAVVHSLTYILHVATPAPSLDPTNLISVVAVGNNVVKVGTAKPDPLVPVELSAASASILASSAYLGNDNINPLGTGTGPFIMTAQNLPQSITLKANPNYWGGPVHIANAQVRYVSDGQTAVALVETNEAQLASSLPSEELGTLKADPKLIVLNQAIPRFTALYFNNKKAPFTDVRVRQAIQSAIDANSIATQVLSGGGVAASGPFRSIDPWAPSGAAVVPYDPTHAKALLAAAGVNPSSLHLQLLTYSDRPELPLVATAIQGMLSKIGLNVTLKVETYNAEEPDLLAGKFDMALASRNYEFYAPDPLSFLQSDYTCSGTFNISQFCNSSIDAQLQAAAQLSTDTARYAVYSQVASYLQSNAVNVFVYDENEFEAYSTSLRGFQLYLTEEYYLTAGLSLGS
jgi:peptide/nickel transport system substrate-binding protein